MDPERSNEIIRLLLNLYNSTEYQNNTFVFSENVDYSTYLMNRFVNITHEKQVYLLTGGVSPEYLEEAENARVIFTTFGYSIEGVSFPRMNALLIATPRKSKTKQLIGRILRKDGDTTALRTIVDIVDVKTTLKKQFTARKAFYDIKKYKITYI